MRFLRRNFDYTFLSLALSIGLILSTLFFQRAHLIFTTNAHADNNQITPSSSSPHFITIYDGEKQIQLKTTASTVGEVLKRAKINTSNLDIVEPDLHAGITSEKFYINIYRSRPVLVVDGAKQKIIETASFDEENIIKMSGFTLFDGDKIKISHNEKLLLSGVSAVYQINRSGGSLSQLAKKRNTTHHLKKARLNYSNQAKMVAKLSSTA